MAPTPTSLGDDVENHIIIKINGTIYKVKSCEVPIDTSLNAYIRDYAKLPGTKFMCKEGGCGSCVVVVESTDPSTNHKKTYAVNSCLLKVWSCYGASITTIEAAKYVHFNSSKLSIADQLACNNGSQCGYCSPGMVMNMYGLMKSKGPNLTENDVEQGFSGNICRCTGYRPILKAFRSLVNPLANPEPYEQDIEDSACANNCPMRKRCISSEDEELEACFIENALGSPSFKIKFPDGKNWYHPTTVKEVVDEIFDQIGGESYMLINGNTASGVDPKLFRDPPVKNYIDLRDIAELHTTSVSKSGIEVGANITLTDFISVLNYASTSKDFGNLFKYAAELKEHVLLVANVPVRNTGTIAGNLTIKYEYLHSQPKPLIFQSDIFLLLETVNAKLTIQEQSSIKNSYSPSKFIDLPSMKKKLITKVWLPPMDSSIYNIRTYKIMPRAQNAPASVNAGFLFKMTKPNSTIIDTVNIVYGAINPYFVHPERTESYLKGKDISKEKVLHDAINELKKDLKPVSDVPPALSPAYRRQLAINLFYKTVLWKNRNKTNPKYKSGGEKLELSRNLSSGKSVIKTKPVGARGKQIPKLEAHIQCRGEAEYVNDIPVIHNQLYSALVVTPKGPGILGPIDPKKALAISGVIAFYSASDIPGRNSMFPGNLITPEPEELFCSKVVRYAGQPVGVIVATSQDLAVAAARKVIVNVLNHTKPLLSVDDVITKYGPYPNERILPQSFGSGISHQQETSTEDVPKEDCMTINGELDMGSQYHYTMELQSCVVIPIEDGQYDVYPASQWALNIQTAISRVLGIADNKVNVFIRRVGGAYGSKITKSAFAAGANAVASHLLKKPVRMVMDLEINTKAIGKRAALKCFYSVTVNKKTGKIIKINKFDFLNNKGITVNEPVYVFTKGTAVSCYDIKHLVEGVLKSYAVITDIPSTAWCRAPGSLEGLSGIEYIMNKISASLNMDPLQVRLNNINQSLFKNFVNDKKTEVNYQKQLDNVKAFNQNNRWRKQGFSMIPMQYPIDFYYQFYCTVSINAADGSISIAHGASEIGQGINTKAAVAAAYIFGLPDVSRISVKPTNIVYSPNNFVTGGSMASDSISYACMRACLEIKDRLDKMKKELQLPDDIPWEKLIGTANNNLLNLNATFMYKPSTEGAPTAGSLQSYIVSGVCASLVEVDILTGQHIVRHTWLWEDAGESLAPLVDLGQLQGAFIMGLGYFTSEDLQYDPNSGELLTNRTWNYDPPGAKDIPEIFDCFLEDQHDLGGKENLQTHKVPPPPYGVTGAKATGEPPLCLSVTVLFAIKEAIRSAREDAGLKEIDFSFDPPATIAVKVMSSMIDDSQFKITSNN